MAVGHAKIDRIFYSKAKGVGKAVVYVGSKTGRDGIHGASMASAEFDENSDEKKPTVQVGDPFTEKLLLEACLELMRDDSIIAIQDMGAAGLTSSSVEMASKGSLGIELELDKVPCREENMTPYEMMLSESQERMLIILEDGKEDHAREIFKKWDLDFVVIGKTTNTKKLTLKFNKVIQGEIPIDALASKAPVYDRKLVRKKSSNSKVDIKKFGKIKIEDALIKILSSPNHSSKNWITEQYDQMVMCDTAKKSGSDAAIIRIHNKDKAIAVSVDSSANYCKADPLTGGKQIVCENWRNLIAVGAKPLAITNCLNFGNPENKVIMGEFADCLEGIKKACEFLNYPVVSGNVSFYNGTNKKNIFPTPVIGGVGLIKKLSEPVSHKFKDLNSVIILVGKTFGHLGQSCFLKENFSVIDGKPPEINLINEKNNGETVLELINQNLINSAHDVSNGGLILALSEMAIGSNLGLKVEKNKNLRNLIEFFFGEDQGRYILEVKRNKLANVEKILKSYNIHFEKIGFTQKKYFEIEGEMKTDINDLFKINNQWYNNY